MKKFLAVCLIGIAVIIGWLFIPGSPDYWEYAPGKWVAHKEKIELAWDYDASKIDTFQIDREKITLGWEELTEIIVLIDEKRYEGLAEKIDELRSDVKIDQKTTTYISSEKRSFVDREEPLPAYGDVCFYKVRAVKGDKQSNYAQISVIFVQ